VTYVVAAWTIIQVIVVETSVSMVVTTDRDYRRKTQCHETSNQNVNPIPLSALLLSVSNQNLHFQRLYIRKPLLIANCFTNTSRVSKNCKYMKYISLFRFRDYKNFSFLGMWLDVLINVIAGFSRHLGSNSDRYNVVFLNPSKRIPQ
jgi:hypothetical protein